MDLDLDRIDDAVLALLQLTAFDDHGAVRAWKNQPWDVLDRLHEKGMLANPRGKAKSVILTQDGAALSQELFRRLFSRSG